MRNSVWVKDELSFGHVTFEMPVRHQNEAVKQAVGYVSMEFRERSDMEIQIRELSSVLMANWM